MTRPEAVERDSVQRHRAPLIVVEEDVGLVSELYQAGGETVRVTRICPGSLDPGVGGREVPIRTSEPCVDAFRAVRGTTLG